MFDHTRAVCFLVIVLAASITFAQTEFSADLVDLQKPGAPTLAKIYFVEDKRRIEMKAASGEDTIVVRVVQPTASKRGVHLQVGGRGDTIIMDLATNTSIVLWPGQKSYVQESLKKLAPAELYGLYAFIQPKNADDACREWMQRKGAEGESCRNLGGEMVNGRSTVKYELSCYGEVCRLWIDRSLHVLVKRETKWNGTELRNIQEGPQPASLFEVPAGYNSKTLGGIFRPTFPQ
jgi:hypothetical protein